MALSRSTEKRRAARKIARAERALEDYRNQEVVKQRMERMRARTATNVTVTIPTAIQTQIKLPLKYFGR